VEVAASQQLAFAVLTDYDSMSRFLPGMLSSKAVARDARTAVVEQTADEGVLFFKQRVTARLAIEEFPPNRLTIRSLGGSFKELSGLYVLTRKGDRTLIEYSARFIPAFELPPVGGMFVVQHSLERHLEGLAAEMARRNKQGDAAAPQPPAPAAVRGE
jgi:carbon monoxide dehydrogenase subunit G